MKKFCFLTISLCAAAAVAFSSGGNFALAEDNPSETQYPEEFQTRIITDYAVRGDSYAYAAENIIAVYRGDEKPVYYEKDKTVTAVDCINDAFVYQIGESVYSLETDEEVSYQIKPTELPVATGGYSYTVKPDKTIKTTDKDGNDGVVQGEFSNLKVYGNAVYALCGNVLNKINPPDTATPIPYRLDDFSATEKIAVGNTVTRLNTVEKLRFVTLKDGEYLTVVYLDEDNFNKSSVNPADFFKVGKTFKVGEEKGFNDGQVAILICTTGNADVISLKGNCYLKLHYGETITEIETGEKDIEFATFNVPPYDFIYSAPVMNDATKLCKINFGDFVKVEGKVSKSDCGELATDFYKVILTDKNGEPALVDGKEISGYVPCSFLYEKQETGGANKTDDPEPSEEDLVKTVVLILVVIILVLTAIGYITYACTNTKQKKPKNDKQ